MSNASVIRPFRIETSQQDIEGLIARVNAGRWPDQLPDVSWDYGVDRQCLQDLVEYWRTQYDWREHELRINEFPQFRTEIDSQNIHFVHVRSRQADAVPVLLTHGWPSTFADFLGLVNELVQPSAQHASDAPAFHVVIPSVPGFGYSGPTRESGWGVDRIAGVWAQLMRRLGYRRYLVQGGDFGSLISPAVARIDPAAVIGVHVNALINGASVDWTRPDPLNGLSTADIASVRATEAWWNKRSGYAQIQATRPQTLAYALNDSPVGLLAWILDLEWGVGDDVVRGEVAVDRDSILTVATIYWLTQTAGSSMRIYREHGNFYRDMPYTATPAAVACFPRDDTVRAVAERHLNVVRFTRYDRGGHFAALQAPDLLVADIRGFTRQLLAADPTALDYK